jgi:hypothetical protein
MKGGQLGQGFHQSKFFFNFIKKYSNEAHITDNNTYMGLLLLNKYNNFSNLHVVPTRQFVSSMNDPGFLKEHNRGYLLVNYPDLYGLNEITYDDRTLRKIAENERKPRKICYLKFFRRILKNSFCDTSNGGKVLRIEVKD